LPQPDTLISQSKKKKKNLLWWQNEAKITCRRQTYMGKGKIIQFTTGRKKGQKIDREAKDIS